MKRKFCILILIMILIISLLSVSASALSFTASMTANNSNVEAASEVVITVKVSNLDVGDSGINSFSAFLYYDADVFETTTSSSVEGMNRWIAAYAPGTGKITLEKSAFVNSDEEIMQISLKTKSGLAEGTQGEVRLSNIKASNSATEISASAVSTNITVGQAASTTPEPVEPSNTIIISGGNTTNTIRPATNTIIPANTTNPSNTISINTSNTSNTNTNVENRNTTISGGTGNTTNRVAEEDIPYTGSESNALSRIIIGFIFIALAIYIKIERMNDVK